MMISGAPRISLLAVALLVAALLASCAVVPTSTLTAQPPAGATLLTPAPCSPDEVLHQVDMMLAGSTFEAHYLTINRQLVLSIWLVDPELDPDASEGDILENSRQAFLLGASISHEVAWQIPCTGEVFEGINPMIVDRDYNSWYVDIIPMRALLQVEHPTDEELVASIERSGMEIAYLRRTSPQGGEHAAPEDACTWPEARAEIQEFFGAERRNAAAYLISGYQAASGYTSLPPQVFVQIQWDVTTPEEADDRILLDNIERASKPLSCLSPPVDRVEIYIVDEDGQLLVFGLIPGKFIREQIFPLPVDQISLVHFNRP